MVFLKELRNGWFLGARTRSNTNLPRLVRGSRIPSRYIMSILFCHGSQGIMPPKHVVGTITSHLQVIRTLMNEPVQLKCD